MKFPIFYKHFITLAAVAATSLCALADNYLDRSGWSWSCSSEIESDGGGIKAIADGDRSTYWHSNYQSSNDKDKVCPHWIVIDRGSDKSTFEGFSYLPRYGSFNNLVTEFSVYLSDKSFGNITYVENLGNATYTGTFPSQNENYDECTFSFGKKHTERYMVFVIENCNSGRSAAIAEFNLLSTSGSTTTPTSAYNSVLIQTYAGDKHRIAMDGDNLTVSLSDGAVRMGNTGYTVEYEIPEVRYFSFENYEFPEETYYVGTKPDIYGGGKDPVHFTMAASVDGKIYNNPVTAIRFCHAERVPLKVDSKNDYVTLQRGVEPVYKWSATDLNKAYNPSTNVFDFSGLNIATDGVYTLTVPAFMLSETDCPINKNLLYTATFSIDMTSSLTEDAVPTLTFRTEGGYLKVGGITSGTEAILYSINGSVVASAAVNLLGNAYLPIASLPRGAYVLSVDGKSFKLTF